MTLIDNNYTQENANVGFPGNLTGLKSAILVEVVNIVCCKIEFRLISSYFPRAEFWCSRPRNVSTLLLKH